MSISGQVVKLEKYDTFISSISKLKNVLNSDFLKIAIVGTPCQIHSIRKMQELKILPAHVVKYTIGLFCNMNFSLDTKTRLKMEEKFGFTFNEIVKMNVREDMIIYFNDKDPIHISFEDLKEFSKKACASCDDFSNVYADIAFGGIESERGHDCPG